MCCLSIARFLYFESKSPHIAIVQIAAMRIRLYVFIMYRSVISIDYFLYLSNDSYEVI